MLALVCFIYGLTPTINCWDRPVSQQAIIPQANMGRWILTGSLNTARYGHTATLLSNGKVLVAGGRNVNNIRYSAELYDPDTGTWSATGDLNLPRSLHTATLLEDGKVLVAGGYSSTASPSFGVTNTAELYDPATGTWSLTGDLNATRAWHTATLLGNGKVLVAAGATDDYNGAELYDPVTGTWTVTGRLIAARYGHTATLLENGKVLVAGGTDDGDIGSTLNSAELYDPNTGTWSLTGSLNGAPVLHTATLLPDGKVLVTGGYNSPPTSLRSAELYDPTTGEWSNSRDLNAARDRHTATLLPEGTVLIAGGEDWTSDSLSPSAELYDPATGIWVTTAHLRTLRFNHTATILNNGRVLVAGGDNGLPNGTLRSAELYEQGATVTPRILSVIVTGKKLFVTGEGFDSGAVILLNGKEYRTRNDTQNSEARLIVQKAGKKIKPGDRVQVRNPDGSLSEEFTFTAS
jgi:N-acetylneuraminic acid mutarotase